MNEPMTSGSRLFSIWTGGEFGAGSGSAPASTRTLRTGSPPTLTTRRAPPDGVFEAVHLPPRRDRRLDIAAPEGATV